MIEGGYMTEKDIRRLEVFSKHISIRQSQRLYRGFKM